MKKLFLFPSFDIPLKEKQILNNFLEILEDSGVGKIIENIEKMHKKLHKKY